jgi:lipopolysaccharide/colanic/teichoic acid biosynthesis glycosyltransferase
MTPSQDLHLTTYTVPQAVSRGLSPLRLRALAPLARRALDVTSSALGLLFLAPLLLAVSLAIKATSRGPLLFSQERVGRAGKSRALRRLEVTPGLTCLWQISGRSNLSFEKQVDLDLLYIDQSTPVDNLKILVKTVPAVLTGRGAC